ncbi:acyltransferase [Rhodococcus sp. NM-2]|uniref:acyltransferase n=1 Tax=Rhodococcus sp. NM-2 TaxID=3401174 RepID=UPI003AAEE0FD
MRFVTIVQASAFAPVWLRVLLLMAAGAKVWGAGIYSGCYFGSKDVTMGLGTVVNRGVLFDGTAPITLGKQVAVGHRVQFVTSTHEIGPSSGRGGRVLDGPIVIGDGCWIGAGAIILPGVTVGKGASSRRAQWSPATASRTGSTRGCPRAVSATSTPPRPCAERLPGVRRRPHGSRRRETVKWWHSRPRRSRRGRRPSGR